MTPRDRAIVKRLFAAGVSVAVIAAAFCHSRYEVESTICKPTNRGQCGA